MSISRFILKLRRREQRLPSSVQPVEIHLQLTAVEKDTGTFQFIYFYLIYTQHSFCSLKCRVRE